MKYVVTGVNKHSGVREAMSRPCSEWKAQQMMLKLRDKEIAKGTDREWYILRVMPAYEGEVFFEQEAKKDD